MTDESIEDVKKQFLPKLEEPKAKAGWDGNLPIPPWLAANVYWAITACSFVLFILSAWLLSRVGDLGAQALIMTCSPNLSQAPSTAVINWTAVLS